MTILRVGDNKKRSLPGQRPRKRSRADLKIGHYMDLAHSRDDADESPATALVFELNVAGDEREQRIVFALPDIFAGLVLRAALTNDDRARVDELTAETLYAKPLTV
jgi:hypothetical protein